MASVYAVEDWRAIAAAAEEADGAAPLDTAGLRTFVAATTANLTPLSSTGS